MEEGRVEEVRKIGRWEVVEVGGVLEEIDREEGIEIGSLLDSVVG